MHGDNLFAYISIIEGLFIVCMLGWEIFWLRRMYYILQCMPKSDQLSELVNMIKKDRDAVKSSLDGLCELFRPVLSLFIRNTVKDIDVKTVNGLRG